MRLLRSTSTPSHRGFTLVELLVVITILAILSSLTLMGLARAGSRGKSDATKFLIRKLSDAVTEHYETYEDAALTASSLVALRSRMREEMPDAWADIAPSTNVPTPSTAVGRTYQRYKARFPSASKTFQGAECLYMIVTESGLFPDFLGSIKPDRVGDVDEDGAREFLDGWGRPIEFFRWAPGLPSLLTTIQIPASGGSNPRPDPMDVSNADPNAFALFPVIYSAGPDGAAGESGAYGLTVAEDGWPDTSLPHICEFKPKNENLVGAPTSSSHRDDITNHQLIAE